MLKDLLMNKKTLAGAILMFVLYGLMGLGLISQGQFDSYASFAELVLGVGLAHKVYKQVS
jgi:hypothetical protein